MLSPQDGWLHTESGQGVHSLLLQGLADVVTSGCHKGDKDGEPHVKSNTGVHTCIPLYAAGLFRVCRG